MSFGGIEELMPEPNTSQISEALEFSRFRFKLLKFLRLPFDIREPALRELLERTCGGVYRNYLVRAERVEMILKSEDTLELNARVPLIMDHRQSASTPLTACSSSRSLKSAAAAAPLRMPAL